jgi:hypothetical protein
MPWKFVLEHVTHYRLSELDHAEGSAGCFPLCERCWADLATYERMPYYMRLWRIWQADGSLDEMNLATQAARWKAIEDAVLGGG